MNFIPIEREREIEREKKETNKPLRRKDNLKSKQLKETK